MGDFRIKYGKAIGPQNNFFVRTDGLAANGDTTPDVTNVSLLIVQNTAATSITYFDVSSPQGAGNVGWFEGKELRVLFKDGGSTTLVRSNELQLNGGRNATFSSNSFIDLQYTTSSWIETGRSENSDVITSTSANLGVVGTVAIPGSTYLRLNSFASSSAILRRALGGDLGDILTVLGNGGSDGLIIVNSAANDTFVVTSSASSTQITVASNAAVSFVHNGAKWVEVRQAVL